ncbi:MAG TPA: isochorismatase family protein [Candidatus Micrarchaeia archaeon]|nr:isochorismatase family protein [Candidatus Micrarchaeia archaeon]
MSGAAGCPAARLTLADRSRYGRPAGTALLPVDAQRTMLEGDQAVPGAAAVRGERAGLPARARAAGTVVVQVHNDGPAGSPDASGTVGWELALAPVPGEAVVRTRGSDPCASNPDLAAALSRRGVRSIVVGRMPSAHGTPPPAAAPSATASR